MRKKIFVAVVAFALSACASGYSQFYTPLTNSGTVGLLPAVEAPQLIASSGDPDRDYIYMFTEGYGAIGMSSFNGPLESSEAALKQAMQVGAERVVVSSQYASTVSGVIPITTPSTSTTFSSGNVSAVGSGGSVSGTYTGTSTTYSSQTNYVPYQVQRFDQAAIYFARIERRGFGVLADGLTPEQARAAGTNRGLMVYAVRRGSPAFLADILPNDIILAIDGAPVFESSDIMRAYRDGIVNVTVMRGKETLDIGVPMRSDATW